MSGGGERQDRELRELFAALRRQEEDSGKARGAAELVAAARSARTRRPMSPAARRPRALAAGLAALALGATGIFAAWLWLRGAAIQPTTRHGPAASIGSIASMASVAPTASIASIASITPISAWRPATDFLLRVPGREILAAVPSFGQVPSLGVGVGVRPPASDSTTREQERRMPR
jgi:hypothetical protein